MSRLFILALLTACTSSTDTGGGEDSDPAGVECGAPETFDVEITAKVISGKDPAEGIEVALDDRGYTGDILGSGTTGADGKVTFTAVGVTSLAGCWGIVLNYWLVATDPADDTRTDESDMNTELYNAIDGGSLATDVSDRPLEL